ncbi:MFS transporter [Sphingomonas sp.]|uniref:MFS transporter n=1 Tax=Sphingomonas sp. TaxID=28214 RepID=UPI0031DE6DAC
MLSAAGTALGGLLFGSNTTVISGATGTLQARFAMTDASLGFIVASALIGTVIGSLVTGVPSDRHGRKTVMLSFAIAYVVSPLGTALAQSWPMLIPFRVLGGLAIGAASVVPPPPPDLHRRAIDRPFSSAAGGHEPAEHRARYPGRVPQQ